MWWIRFSEKYYDLSPYQYGANNPVNNIDINGDSITILNYGYINKQHMAILIQNTNDKWQYFLLMKQCLCLWKIFWRAKI